LATGVPDGVGPVFADNGRLPQGGEEVGWPVEVGHLQIGGADAVRVVRIRARAARKVIALCQETGLEVVFLVFDLVPGFQHVRC
jgi:hypothetical protein